jgi:multicomponent Na+:H+ antiporter subunit D
MYVAMGLAAAVCIVTGVMPGSTLYAVLPYAATYQPFTGHHFLEALQLLTGTALGFWILRVKLFSEPTTTVDVDYLYRQPLLALVAGAGGAFESLGQRTNAAAEAAVNGAWRRARRVQEIGAAASPSVQSTVVFMGVAIATLLALLFSR